jgi:hypothetical protein
MSVRQGVRGVLVGMACVAATISPPRPAAAETFTGTATVKTAGGATATAPVTVVVDRTTAQPEADKLAAAFKTGGAAGLRKALEGVAPAGSVQLGTGAKVPARIAIERATDKGRLLTIVTDTAILHLGAGLPDAAKKEGYDFAVLDLEIGAGGSGSGSLTPAARLAVKGGAFVVEGYSTEPLRITAVTAKK